MPVAFSNKPLNMSENNNGNLAELTTSQINQSEAGPEIVQLDQNLEFTLKAKNKDYANDVRNSDLNDTKSPEALDKLIKQPVNVVAPLKVESRGAGPQQANLEVELSKLHEMLEKQDKMTQQRAAESENQLSQRFSQLCTLQDKIKQHEERDKMLTRKLTESQQEQHQLTVVMQDYEMLIGKLTAEVEAEKQMKGKVTQLMSEKETALVHLSNVEAAFTDVHSKYEKCKKVVEDYKKNDAQLKELIGDLREALRVKEKTLESVQMHAGNQLDAAQRELERIHRDHELELTRLRATVRKTELKVISLQESLDQKIKENQDLTTICDDLIANTGRSHN